MNERYFACRTCKNYIDAGYRFCYWTLEHPGVVERGKPVNLEALWDAEEFWHGGRDCNWLAGLLPNVRTFLSQHREHDIIFGEDEDFGAIPMYDGDYRLFDWLQEPGYTMEVLPRYLVERLDLLTWEQAVAYVVSHPPEPWWWGDPEYKASGKAKFVLLVRGTQGNKAVA